MNDKKSSLIAQFQSCLPDVFQANGLEAFLTEEKCAQFAALGAALLLTNEKMNLTAITDPKSVTTRHLADSLLALKSPHALQFIPVGAKVLDVGCGGGFPCLPLAIARPDLTIVALDSTAKKLEYIANTVKELQLSNVTTLCGRAEELAKPPLRESFDVVCARAVARLPILCELCLPFVKVKGCFVAMKGGGQAEDELQEASAQAIPVLGAKLAESLHLSLYGEEISQDREIFFLQKVTKTPPLYPRLFTQIKKKPL